MGGKDNFPFLFLFFIFYLFEIEWVMPKQMGISLLVGEGSLVDIIA
jgi:hypothetical protein